MRNSLWKQVGLGAGAAMSVGAAEALAVRDARIPAPLPGQDVAAGYMTVESPVDARVVAAEADAARVVQFHVMSMGGEIMRMRRVEALDLGAGRAVRLEPGGVHLMLIGLSKPLRPGDAVDIRLTLSAAGGARRVVSVTLPVVDRREAEGGGHD